MRAMVAMAQRFEGFPGEAFDFYDALAANNTRPWWNEHKADYQRLVRDPFEALLAELTEEFGTPHLFRPYRELPVQQGQDADQGSSGRGRAGRGCDRLLRARSRRPD